MACRKIDDTQTPMAKKSRPFCEVPVIVRPTMRTRGRVSGNAVAAFLILEPQFPRSVTYSVKGAFDRLSSIRPPTAHDLPGGRALERMRVLDSWLREQTPQGLAAQGAVHEVLTHVVDESQQICSDVAEELFGYGSRADPPPQAILQ